VRSEDQLDARLDDPSETVVDPIARVRRGFDEESVAGELHGPQRGEPDPVGRLVDSEGKLLLHARPYVLELGAHGSVNPLLSPRK
jgi:hypothetical protein